MAIYTYAILGSPTSKERRGLMALITELVNYHRPEIGINLRVVKATELQQMFRGDSSVVAYFGHETYKHETEVANLVDKQVPVIPVFRSSLGFFNQIPSCLSDFNGYDLDAEKDNLIGLATTMLECIGLLEHRKKVFISYVQNQSRAVAFQLYEALLKQKLDVFLDTHSIGHGVRLTDAIYEHQINSDVMILLNTQSYHSRPMTTLEYVGALNRNISILPVIWPRERVRQKQYLNKPFRLKVEDFDENMELLTESKIEEIVLHVQRLRCSSMAAQQQWMHTRIYELIENMEGNLCGIGPHFSHLVQLKNSSTQCLFPQIGIPDSIRMNEVVNHAVNSNLSEKPIVVYNKTNIPEFLLDHLSWLDKELSPVWNTDVGNLTEKLTLIKEETR